MSDIPNDVQDNESAKARRDEKARRFGVAYGGSSPLSSEPSAEDGQTLHQQYSDAHAQIAATRDALEYEPRTRAIEPSDGVVPLARDPVTGAHRGTEEVLFSGPYMLKRIVLVAGARTSVHFHYCKTETNVVVEGQLRIELEDGTHVTLLPGEHHTLREGRVNAHRMIALGDTDCVFLEASTPHPGDSERLRW